MRSKNEVLCPAVGRLAAERSEADKLAKAHKTIFAPNNIYKVSIKEHISRVLWNAAAMIGCGSIFFLAELCRIVEAGKLDVK
jgi:hypothetical protein